MDTYEKLGVFYLGRHHDLGAGRTAETPLLYDSKDLTTHAVCVGMTGSGKTGLCVSLLEEAAMDGIPAIAIDPKGDLGNLMLTFPELRGTDFRPWIDEDAARRKQLSPEQFAEQQATLWRDGLAKWDQSGERIARLRAAAEFAIYTPGSDAGWPVSVLSSFAAPPAEVLSDGDLLRERVSSTAASLLGLLEIDADPLSSREHILISTILGHLWRAGSGLDLPGLIRAIQTPPVERVGVMDLETFIPEKQRFELAMRLNSLLAAPGFQGWLTGQPLDVGSMLYTPQGRPRVAICSIAHLSDNERMFFVSLLLNEIISWMRSRPGTSSLRALLYMDEIFGYAPPNGEPPSKKPLLTLLKQARAYGLGVVLATQNPVDLDYKGLSNTGTWFLGRLQTERDKLRVLDGLEGAGAGSGEFDRGRMEQVLAGLGKRVFLMHDVHRAEPVIFQTRWAMSYLRGPLTRPQIKQLMAGRPAAAGESPPTAARPRVAGAGAGERPVLPRSVPQVFLPAASPFEEGELHYEPQLVGIGRVRYVDRKTKKLKYVDEVALMLPLGDAPVRVDWEQATKADLCPEELEPGPEDVGGYGSVAAEATQARSYTGWKRDLADTLYRNRSLDLHKSPSLGLTSEPGETEAQFRVRLTETAREKRDALADKLRKKYERRGARLEDRIRRAQQAVDREKQQASSHKLQTAISFGATLLSAVLGRKATSAGTIGKATTTARGVGRAMKEGRDVGRARENVEALRVQLDELNRELEEEVDLLEERIDPLTEEFETTSLRPRRADVDVRLVALAWTPHRAEPDGTLTPL